jgi:hypothetical protein
MFFVQWISAIPGRLGLGGIVQNARKGSGASQIDLDVGSSISMASTEQNSLTIFFS